MSHLKGGNASFADIDERILSSSKKVLLQNIEFKEGENADGQAQKIYSKYKPINSAYNFKELHSNVKQNKHVQKPTSTDKEIALPVPKIVLYPPDKVEMEWKQLRRIGPGFANLGNTCFLNSVLQVLTYTAPLINFMNSDAHKNTCASVGFCMLCEFRNHVIRIAKHHPQHGPIRPMTIIQKLSYISKNFKFGRQEDAHEFLRYLIEALRKSCLVGKNNLDRLSKETTAINQIFGGFFRSQVTCLACKTESNTYDPMMELNLDIKETNTIINAMKKTIKTERLDGENKYFCEKCRRKTPALKRGNIHTAPKILTLQLKRFDFQRLYGGKISKEIQFPEDLDLSSFMSNKSEIPMLYKLYAVLVHSGFSCNSGHYYCYVKAPNGTWYEMNDSRVSQVALRTVLRAQAYLLFYTVVEKTKLKEHQKTPQKPKIYSASPKPNGIPVQQKTPNQQKSLFAKDIGISITRSEPRSEPRIIPLGNNRDKLTFSWNSSTKKKPENLKKETTGNNDVSSKTSKTNLIQSVNGPKEIKRSSLDTLRKDYDSGDSDTEVKELPKSEGITKKKTDKSEESKTITKASDQNNDEDNVSAKTEAKPSEMKEEPSVSKATKVQDSNIESDKKPVQNENDDVLATKAPFDEKASPKKPEDTFLSPPKSSEAFLSPPKSSEAGHQRRMSKTPFGTPQLSSKFGRWHSVKSGNQSMQPRVVLHRSMSDSIAFEKSKKALTSKEIHRQISSTVSSNHKGEAEKAAKWSVEVKKSLVQDIIGPMTPPVKIVDTKNNDIRERTSSITSETGSLSTITGDWEIHDKDLPGTPLPPVIPERHFAGWSVKKNFQEEENEKQEKSSGKTPRELFPKEGRMHRHSTTDRKDSERRRSAREEDNLSNHRRHFKNARDSCGRSKSEEDATDGNAEGDACVGKRSSQTKGETSLDEKHQSRMENEVKNENRCSKAEEDSSTYRRRSNATEDFIENPRSHSKKSKKRSHSENILDDEEKESLSKKRRKSRDLEKDERKNVEQEESSRKKSKKSKKKKKHRHRENDLSIDETQKSFNEIETASTSEEKRKSQSGKIKKHKESEETSRGSSCESFSRTDKIRKDKNAEVSEFDGDKCDGEKHAKKRKKNKKSKSREEEDDKKSSRRSKSRCKDEEKKRRSDEEDDSRYSSVKTPIKTPRRVQLTCLGGVTSLEKSDSYCKDSPDLRQNVIKKSSKKKKKDSRRKHLQHEERESATSDNHSTSRDSLCRDSTQHESQNGDHIPKTSSADEKTFTNSTKNGSSKDTPNGKQSANDVPSKKWDEAPKKTTSWNGSSSTLVRDTLLSKKSKVQTWEDKASETMTHAVGGKQKRSRDQWDDEYDEGKTKKIKKHHSLSSIKLSHGNLFQKCQDRRNHEKTADR